VNHVLVTPPAEEPVSLAEAKAHLRVDHDAEDTLISMLIGAAREYVEQGAARALMPQTWRLSLESLPGGRCPIELPLPPLRSVESITYQDDDGAEQTLDDALYLVDTDDEPGKVLPVYDGEWPDGRCDVNAVKVTYIAGYEDADHVPKRAKQAILLLVGHWFENREAVGTAGRELEMAVTNLMGQLWHGRLR
jgi:uncharacterized phiE125 gp8 family phage protein